MIHVYYTCILYICYIFNKKVFKILLYFDFDKSSTEVFQY